MRQQLATLTQHSMTHQTSNSFRAGISAFMLVALLVPQASVLAVGTSTPGGLMEKRKEMIETRQMNVQEKKMEVRGKVEDAKVMRASSTPMGDGANFCKSFDALGKRVQDSIPKREDKRGDARDNMKGKLDDRRASTTAKLDDKRLDWDSNRSERYDKIMARASTTEQQAAVTAFKASVDAAVSTRRSAIDAAVATFRAGSSRSATFR